MRKGSAEAGVWRKRSKQADTSVDLDGFTTGRCRDVVMAIQKNLLESGA